MKRFATILSLIVLVTVTGFSAPNTFKNDFTSLNKEFNEYVFLLRSTWNYLDNNTITKAKIYNNTTLVSTIVISTGTTKDDSFSKIFKRIYNDSNKITKIKLYTDKGFINNIDIVNNKLTNLSNSKLEGYAIKQLTYLNDNDLIQHNRGSVDMDGRIAESDIDYQGIFAENIAACNSSAEISTNRKRVMLTIKKYYNYRTRTQHFNEIMSLDYKFYTTRFLQDGKTLYSLTVMTNYKLVK